MIKIVHACQLCLSSQCVTQSIVIIVANDSETEPWNWNDLIGQYVSASCINSDVHSDMLEYRGYSI